MKKKNIIKCLLIAIGISIILYIAVTTISIWNYSKLDEKKLTDVVIVLGAGTSNGEVSPVFQERINHGIWLYEIEAYSSPTPTTRYISLKSKLPFLAREEFFYIGYRIYRNFQ